VSSPVTDLDALRRPDRPLWARGSSACGSVAHGRHLWERRRPTVGHALVDYLKTRRLSVADRPIFRGGIRNHASKCDCSPSVGFNRCSPALFSLVLELRVGLVCGPRHLDFDWDFTHE
jgi:hypothetical protein